MKEIQAAPPTSMTAVSGANSRSVPAAIVVRPKIAIPADTITSAHHRDRERCITRAPSTAPQPKQRSRIPYGIEPAPERSRKTTWKEFLSQHWELIVAADFFTVEVWTRRGLQRFIVLFFIELSTRKVEIAGIAAAANGLWMRQIGRDLTGAVERNV